MTDQAQATPLALSQVMAGLSLLHESFEADGTSFFDVSTLRSLVGPLVGVCIWIPYMINSVRVRNTFVK